MIPVVASSMDGRVGSGRVSWVSSGSDHVSRRCREGLRSDSTVAGSPKGCRRGFRYRAFVKREVARCVGGNIGVAAGVDGVLVLLFCTSRLEAHRGSRALARCARAEGDVIEGPMASGRRRCFIIRRESGP